LKGKLCLIWLLAVLLTLTACTPSLPQGASRAQNGASEAKWQGFGSDGALLEISYPAEWTLENERADGVSLRTPSDCSLRLERLASDARASLSQSQLLDRMLREEEQYYAQEEQKIELVGKRVWLGQHYIWHEIHHTVTWQEPCHNCLDAYCVDFLAFASEDESLALRFLCPGVSSLSEEAETQLLQAVDSVILSTGRT